MFMRISKDEVVTTLLSALCNGDGADEELRLATACIFYCISLGDFPSHQTHHHHPPPALPWSSATTVADAARAHVLTASGGRCRPSKPRLLQRGLHTGVRGAAGGAGGAAC